MLSWLTRPLAPTRELAAGDGIRLVVGLGNPGAEYARTRHNFGFLALDRLAERHRFPVTRKFKKALTGSWHSPAGAIVVAKPQTYMNASGESVAAILAYYNLKPSQALIVCDDVALPFERLRIRPSGSEGGHNGLRSISQRLGTREYPRLRLGVGHPGPPGKMIDYVLHVFPREEWEKLPSVLERAVEVIEVAVTEGVTAAMNRFNGA